MGAEIDESEGKAKWWGANDGLKWNGKLKEIQGERDHWVALMNLPSYQWTPKIQFPYGCRASISKHGISALWSTTMILVQREN
ncbi:hypothetical protein AB1N83_012953 [Pleurotus pulmonarius]